MGIDPGSAITGYGIIEHLDRRSRLIECGCIRTEAGSSLPARLKRIYDGLVEVMTTYRPDTVAIEETFYGKNARAALTMGHARGVALLAAANEGMEVVEYSPREVKQSVVGSGGASKEQVQFMVKVLLSLPRPPQPEDAADAVAVALCHANRAMWRVMTR